MHHINHAMFSVCRVVRQKGWGRGGAGQAEKTIKHTCEHEICSMPDTRCKHAIDPLSHVQLQNCNINRMQNSNTAKLCLDAQVLGRLQISNLSSGVKAVFC